MASSLGDVITKLAPRARGKIAWITISRPSKLNSLNTHLLTRLPSALDAVQREHEDLLGIVLTGDGNKAFIGGADLLEMGGLKAAPEASQFITRVHQACQSIRTCCVPVIARLNGYTLGAGLEIAASCDVRVASRKAVFGMPEVRVGIPSVVEAVLLPSLIGWGRARQMMLLGQNISAEEALKWGLVENVVDKDALDEAVEDWIQQLDLAAPDAVRSQKALIRRWEEEPSMEKRIQMSVEAFASSFSTKGADGLSTPERAMAEFAKKRTEKGGGSKLDCR